MHFDGRCVELEAHDQGQVEQHDVSDAPEQLNVEVTVLEMVTECNAVEVEADSHRIEAYEQYV